MIIEKVFVHGGDVLKFAGDSIFVEWAVMEHGLVTIEQCTALAALCAASVAQSCRDFPIFVGEKTVGFLNLHCSLGVGDVAVVHFGDDRIRREFLLLGDPIDQVGFVLVAVVYKSFKNGFPYCC
jgi:class 3 adenylate cyclase